MTASIMAARTPRCSRVRTPWMVLPPGLHTSFFNWSGCLPVSSTIWAAPQETIRQAAEQLTAALEALH